MKHICFLVIIFMSGCSTIPDDEGPWSLDKLFQTPDWEVVDTAEKPGLQGLLYDSVPYKGRRVKAFAYYGVPEGEMPGGGWPAVVCVHGGGGTAFDEWVKLWNSHGYAAISMDLEGHFPIRKGDEEKGPRISTPKPGPSRVGVFEDFKKPIEKQWYYHAVSQVILAHSLIRSFPEVNPDKTGITGISWGGTLTSTTMGVDSRFKFAIPVYGCGFLPDADGFQGENIEPGEKTEWVYDYFDGSAYFGNVRMPTFWVNGTNDRHFSMPSTQESSQSVLPSAFIRYELGMKHGHGEGWAPAEIYGFADSVVKGSDALVQFGKVQHSSKKASVQVTIERELVSTDLYYTLDSGVWPKREWHRLPANYAENMLSAEVPVGAVAVFFSATDDRGFMTSSEFVLMQ